MSSDTGDFSLNEDSVQQKLLALNNRQSVVRSSVQIDGLSLIENAILLKLIKFSYDDWLKLIHYILHD